MSAEHELRSPFHRGEIEIQARLGVRDKIEMIGRRLIRDHMPDEHRMFFAQLPFVVMGSVDAAGRPWASLLTGAPGFVSSPDPRTLVVRARPSGADPLVETLAPGAAIAVLGIELPTRRRNRANGRVTAVTPDEFRVHVAESFGNCPKYIQTRALQPEPTAPRPEPVLDAAGRLTDWARRMIDAADTVFVASYVEAEGATPRMVDVSHRGGRPGFIRVDAAGTLTFPDFTGNFLFNTLGNLLANPRAGLVVPDFRSGDLLYLSGDTDIVWDGPEVAANAGADRLWRLRPLAGSGVRAAIPLRGDVLVYSPHLP